VKVAPVSSPLEKTQVSRCLVLSSALAIALGAGVFGCTSTSEGADDAEKPGAVPEQNKKSARPEMADDAARAKRYEAIKKAFELDPKAAVAGKTFAAHRADLQAIADRADDRFLRANASVMLGHMVELRGDAKGAIAYWRHASKVVDDDAGPFMTLALGLAADKQYAEAATAQAKAAELDPNNLENWLALGELRIRAGDKEGATSAYVDYERVRTSLVNGLTGRTKEGGEFFVGPTERVDCVYNLSSAVDGGTALVLLYALETEPEASVRQAIAEVMGMQRLESYVPRLTERVKTEPNAETKETMAWALEAIKKDPIKVVQGEAASLPADDPRASGAAPRQDPAPASPSPAAPGPVPAAAGPVPAAPGGAQPPDAKTAE